MKLNQTFAICWAAAVALSGATALADFDLLPHGPLNPRVPNIRPVADAKAGHAAPFETEFAYDLSGLGIRSRQISLKIRDNARRPEKRLLTLHGEDVDLQVRTKPAAVGRGFEVVVRRGKETLATLPLKRPADAGWTDVRMEWTDQSVVVIQDGKPAGDVSLASPLRPTKVSLLTWHVSDLRLAGDGEVRLGWDNGYAARVTPGESATVVQARLLGFDTFAISQNPDARDFPMVRLTNASSNARRAAVRFKLTSEINGWTKEWSQSFDVPSRSQVTQAVQFPSPLLSDVYHLSVESDDVSLSARKHFLFVERRPEPAGPAKFGLHDADVKAFGFWPDALAVNIAHVYARWGYIQGPAWVKDVNDAYGIDPAAPPEEWNWNTRLDWAIAEGRVPYVCLQSTPLQASMRLKDYAKNRMTQRDWGVTGGAADPEKYRAFVRAIAERYRGKIWAYEIENEPNSSHGLEVEDYVPLAKVVYEEVKKADPAALVYGICGTGKFIEWMKKAFALGAAQYMDGISWHTYTTPKSPDQVDLPAMLADARAIIKAANPKLSIVNSETGTYVAMREEVDRDISEARLGELIKQGIKPLSISKGFPTRAVSEKFAAAGVVPNAVYNFLSGAEFYGVFGWNPNWPIDPKWWNKNRDAPGFVLISASKDGERTPNLYALATGVLMAQLEPADHRKGTPVEAYGLRGAVYPKTSTGRVAVLWSTVGPQTVLLNSSSSTLDVVSLYGQKSTSTGVAEGGGFVHAIDLGGDAIYVHDHGQSLRVVPPVVETVDVTPSHMGTTDIKVTLRNPFDVKWDGVATLAEDAGWSADARERSFAVAAKGRETVNFAVKPVGDAAGGRRVLKLSLKLPDGRSVTTSADVPVLPTFTIAAVPEGVTAAGLSKWDMPGGPLALNRPEQLTIGRPPALASLQERAYWGGVDELSAKVRIGRNMQGLAICVDVRDAYMKPPSTWPGVDGSSVEIFLDVRPAAAGLTKPSYTKDVYQIVLRPAVEKGQSVKTWIASRGSRPLPKLAVSGSARGKDSYWVSAIIPWSDLNVTPTDGMAVGVDVAVNGAKEEGGRKSQMVLFGDESNSRDASHFGLGFLGKAGQ